MADSYQQDGIEYHCFVCMSPIEHWQPLETYKGDCCGLFSDFFGDVWELEEHPYYSKHNLYQSFLKTASDYPDIPNIKNTFNELVEIQLDCGVITKMVDLEGIA